MSEKKKLKIKIFDKEYSLLVENEEIAKELAIYVNKVMEETKEELPDQPAQTRAISACLNIAYDFFLEKNKSNAGVKVTPSGLQYEIIKEGTGKMPADSDMVKVHYHGTLVDGKVFDSSVDRGEPAQFPVGEVIPGWTEALKMMPVGSKWKIYLPANLGYGERAPQEIGPNKVLIFEVELLEIVPKTAAPAR